MAAFVSAAIELVVILEDLDRSITDLVVPVVTEDVGEISGLEISAEAVRVPFELPLMTWDRFPVRF